VKSVRVPTEAMWNGDLSDAQDTAGSPITIYDPLTADANGNRQPFTGNIIPPDRISATAKTLSALTARPTDNVNPYRALNFVHFYPHRTKLWNLTIKGDQHFGDKDSLSSDTPGARAITPRKVALLPIQQPRQTVLERRGPNRYFTH
jgi:hypothetical protein